MLSWPPTVRIFLCSDAADMRKGFDSLAHLVESALALDPLSGHLFVFRSRRGDRIKILYWDKDGYAMWYKRLEKGSFCFPAAPATAETTGVEIKAADLMMLLDGIDLGSDRGGRTAAILYSMTGSCKHHDIDPFAYLTDILRRLPSHPAQQLDELLPDVWFTSHPSARRKKAA